MPTKPKKPNHGTATAPRRARLMPPAQAEAFIRADVARNAELLRLANFQPE